MTIQEMEVNAALIVPAGSDTISTGIVGCLYLLLTNPEAMARLHKELDSTFKSEEDITMTRVTSLVYLKAAIDEALRMYPSIPGDLRREIPQGGAVVCDNFIPQGTIISVYTFAISNIASNFAQPQRFCPERWLASERPEWAKGDHLEACQPFSIGPRNCIGMPLAYAETKLILARLLYRFDLELLDNVFELEKQRVYIMWDKPPLRVRLTRRVQRNC